MQSLILVIFIISAACAAPQLFFVLPDHVASAQTSSIHSQQTFVPIVVPIGSDSDSLGQFANSVFMKVSPGDENSIAREGRTSDISAALATQEVIKEIDPTVKQDIFEAEKPTIAQETPPVKEVSKQVAENDLETSAKEEQPQSPNPVEMLLNELQSNSPTSEKETELPLEETEKDAAVEPVQHEVQQISATKEEDQPEPEAFPEQSISQSVEDKATNSESEKVSQIVVVKEVDGETSPVEEANVAVAVKEETQNKEVQNPAVGLKEEILSEAAATDIDNIQASRDNDVKKASFNEEKEAPLVKPIEEIQDDKTIAQGSLSSSDLKETALKEAVLEHVDAKVTVDRENPVIEDFPAEVAMEQVANDAQIEIVLTKQEDLITQKSSDSIGKTLSQTKSENHQETEEQSHDFESVTTQQIVEKSVQETGNEEAPEEAATKEKVKNEESADQIVVAEDSQVPNEIVKNELMSEITETEIVDNLETPAQETTVVNTEEQTLITPKETSNHNLVEESEGVNALIKENADVIPVLEEIVEETPVEKPFKIVSVEEATQTQNQEANIGAQKTLTEVDEVEVEKGLEKVEEVLPKEIRVEDEQVNVIKTEEVQEIKTEEIPIQEIKPEEIKIEEAPVQEIKTEEAPIQEIKTEEAPVQEIKTEEAQNQEIKTEEAPVQEIKTEEAPIQEIKTEEAPVQEIKTEEAPVQEIKTQEASVQDIQIEEAPVQEIKAEEVSLQDIKTDEAQVQETKPELALVQEIKAEEGPAHDIKTDEASIQEIKLDEAPVQEIKLEEAAVKEIKLEEAPVQEIKTEEVSIQEEKIEGTVTKDTLIPHNVVQETQEQQSVIEDAVVNSIISKSTVQKDKLPVQENLIQISGKSFDSVSQSGMTPVGLSVQNHFGFSAPMVRMPEPVQYFHNGAFIDPRTLVQPKFRSFFYHNDSPDIVKAKVLFFQHQGRISPL